MRSRATPAATDAIAAPIWCEANTQPNTTVPASPLLLVLREAFTGTTRFDGFRDALGCADNVLGTHNDLNFSLPQHCYEYCNTLGWFWDAFAHPQRIKLLYLAASYLNQAAHHQKLTGDLLPARIEKPANAGGLGAEQMAAAVEAATIALDAPNAVGWTQAYLESGHDTVIVA